MRTRSLFTAVGALVFAVSAMNGQAQDIARWVDAEGVTHFGNPQFAPGDSREVTLVDVQPANHMVVPEVSTAPSAHGRVVVIKKKGKSNPRGWQGYQKNKNQSNRANRGRR